MKTYLSLGIISLAVLFEQPTSTQATILRLMLSSKPLKFAPALYYVSSDIRLCVQAFNHFQNSRRSNRFGKELFAVTIRLKGEFTF